MSQKVGKAMQGSLLLLAACATVATASVWPLCGFDETTRELVALVAVSRSKFALVSMVACANARGLRPII